MAYKLAQILNMCLYINVNKLILFNFLYLYHKFLPEFDNKLYWRIDFITYT